MNRVTLTKIHTMLAAFMFPVALMFLVTGGLYTWGISGSYDSADHLVGLDQPLAKDEAALISLARAELANRNIAEPTGKPRLRTVADGFQLEWTGSKRDVLLEPTADPRIAKLTVKETTWYRNLVQLHKAKGGVIFKVYAAALAIALFLLLATGFVVAWSVPRFRKLVKVSALAGIVTFGLAIAAS